MDTTQMRIYPFTYICYRDWDLFRLLVASAEKIADPRMMPWTAYYDREQPLSDGMHGFCDKHRIVRHARPDGFFPWCGWKSAMSKLYGWKSMLLQDGIEDSDYIAYFDSDTVLWNSGLLDALTNPYDFIGFPHSVTTYIEEFGRQWSWLSGAFQAMKASCIHMLPWLSPPELTTIKDKMLVYGLSHNEDVVISFLAAFVGATENRLNGRDYHEDDFEAAFRGELTPRSFSHFNYHPQEFLGHKVSGKWDIPKAVEKTGLWPSAT